jgi:formylglycine-generating enzyme required for sulfatase activity
MKPVLFACFLICVELVYSVPQVQIISIEQIPRTPTVRIVYDLASSGNVPCTVVPYARTESGEWEELQNLSGDFGENVVPGPGKEIIWNAGSQWPSMRHENARIRMWASDFDPEPPAGFVRIAGGTFVRGSPPGEPGRDDGSFGEHQHMVEIRRDFHMQTTEVTTSQLADIYNWAADQGLVTIGPAGVTLPDGGPELMEIHELGTMQVQAGVLSPRPGMNDLPANMMTWFGAMAYCNFLSDREGLPRAFDFTDWIIDLDANGYRLPTEAEWEYASRAGTSHAFHTGDAEANLAQSGWYAGNSGRQAQPVGSLQANAWGLFDVFGNLNEWCYDWIGHYPAEPVVDPVGPDQGLPGNFRINRGGNFESLANECRVARRWWRYDDVPSYWVGFRPVRAAGEVAMESLPFLIDLRDEEEVNWLWISATQYEDGWRYLEWFSYFNELEQQPWIYHLEHGYVYALGEDPGSIFLYDVATASWFWTSETRYPWLFKYDTNEGWYWYYRSGEQGNRWFSRMTDNRAVHQTALDFPVTELVPNPPTYLRATSTGSTRIVLEWVENSRIERGFSIEYRKGIIGSFEQYGLTYAQNVFSWTVEGLQPDTPYQFRVKALGPDEDSVYSKVLTVRTLPGG